MTLSIWRSSSSRFKRFLTILAFFLFSITITIAGVLTPLSPEESTSRNEDLKRMQNELKGLDIWQMTSFIFRNNFMISLMMFIPLAGPFLGSYVLYNTGVVIAAESNVMHVPGLTVFFFLFIFPFTWMEFIAYSTAFAASVWLTWRLIQRRGKKEFIRTCIFLAICAVLLFVAALVESVIIASY